MAELLFTNPSYLFAAEDDAAPLDDDTDADLDEEVGDDEDLEGLEVADEEEEEGQAAEE